MKDQIKIKSVFLVFFAVVLSITSYAQYCSSSATYTDYEYISRVVLNDIDNESGSDLYADYTASISTDLYIGESYNILIFTGIYYATDSVGCWIDWNQDEIFQNSERISLDLTGEETFEGTATGVIIPPADAILGATRMRILLVDGQDTDPCLSFDYGEVEDYTINVLGIDAPPVADFTANKRIIYNGESVEFTDESKLVPTSWNWTVSPATVSYIEGTDANSQNPVITFNESGNYTITLEATNDIGTDDTVKTDYIQVKDFGNPRNIEASTEGKHVNLSWDAPNISGIYNYVTVEDAEYIINPGPQRATQYSADDFDFTFPVTLTKISGYFYQSSTESWDDASFIFKIYDQDTSTVLYESGVIEAQHNKEIVHSLGTPLTLTRDFYLAIIPVSESNNPSNLGALVPPYSNNTYVGEPGSWWQFSDETTAFELTTSIYIAGDKSSEKRYSYVDTDYKSEPKEQIEFTLSGYEIYRNGSLIKEITNIDEKSYIDRELPNGSYEYFLKALYQPFGSSPGSDSVEVNVDNTDAEMMLIYNDEEIQDSSTIKLENNVLIDSTKTLTFGIYNEGLNDLNIGEITIDNAEFIVKDAPPSIVASDDTVYFTIEFTPLTDGVKNAQISIINNDDNENPYVFNVEAIGGLDKWTWMVYMLEDNTGLNGAKDINELEVNGSVEGQVNYLVFYDSDNDSKDGIWYIKKDPEGFNYEFVSEKISSQFGLDPDLSDPAILEEFLLWVKENYPAQHYGLTMWDHGSGIFKKSGEPEYGIQKDFVGDMKLWEMSNAVESFVSQSQQKIDVIGFDVCLLGQFETAYQFKDLADYVIASELTEPGDGWNYKDAFEPMTSNPNITPEEIAINITDTYVESYQPGGWQNRQAATQAATSIHVLNNDFVPLFNQFAETLGDLCYDFKSEIAKARNSAWAAISVVSGGEQNPEHRDLGGFLYYIANNEKLPYVITDLANQTMEKYEEMVIAEGHTETLTNGATGLKIWMPTTLSTQGTQNTYYTDPENYLIISYTKWDEYLRKYENPMNNKAPVAEFTVQDTIERGFSLIPVNKSYFGPESFNWEISPSTYEFVNGTDAGSKNPEIKFTETGSYNITLTATNSYGSDNVVQNNCIEVIKPNYKAPTNLSYTEEDGVVTLNWKYASGGEGLNEGFEEISSFPPPGWSIMSNDNLDGSNLVDVEEGANTWGWCDENTFNDPQYIHSGNYSAAIGYTAGSEGDPFNWLLTPEMSLSNDEVLSFWLWYASDDDYHTDFDVMIYSDGQWTSLLHLTDGSGVNLYQEQIVIPLSDYNGKTVKLAFVYQYTDGYQLAIDDILIDNSKKKDAGSQKNLKVKPNKVNTIFSAANHSKNTLKSDYQEQCTNIYRDGTKIGMVSDITSCTFTDTLETNGSYEYYVTMEYSEPEGESDPSNIVTITVDSFTGITDFSASELRVYPNPANEYITIDTPDGFAEGVIQLIDFEGKLILEKHIDYSGEKISVSEIKSGLYIIKLSSKHNSLTNRILIE